MYFLPKTLFCGLLFSICAFAGVEGNYLGLRSLTAVARKPRNLLERGVVDFAPQWNPEFHYVDEDSLATDSPFAARLGFSSKLPVLALEDVELHLVNIRCSEAAIEISFGSHYYRDRAKKVWGNLGNFFVVTSHPGCNYNGERSPYLVSGITSNDGQSAIILSAKVMNWKDTFHSMTVDFGISNEEYAPKHLRRHRPLRKQQGVRRTLATVSPTSFPTSSSISSSGSSWSFPIAPTSLPSATNASKDLRFSQLGTQIFPPTFPGASIVAPETQGWTVSCKNCSANGTIEITHGSFSVASNSSDFLNFLDSGFVTMTTEGFSAHIELETDVQASQQLFEVDVHLLAVPIAISPFQIPGVAAVGAFFDPLLVTSISIDEAFNFTYGFDLSVPDMSQVTIDLSNITNSTTNGFDNTQVKAVPFRSTTPTVGLTFSAGFRPQVLLGIQVLENLGQAKANFFLDLPQVSVTIEPVSNVTRNCLPADNNNNNTNMIGNQPPPHHIFRNLTHIQPSVDLNIGVGLTAGIQIAGQGTFIATDWTITSTAFPLPTACLTFDTKHSLYTPASDPPAPSTTAAASESGGNKPPKKGEAGVVRVQNPFRGLYGGGGGGGGGVIVVILPVVCWLFMAL